MKIRSIAAILALLGSAGAAFAQSGFATWTWQVSTDAGATWQSEHVEVSTLRSSVLVRCLIDWYDPDTNAYAFAGTQFDAVVIGAGPADFVRNHIRPAPLDGLGNREILATRFGNQIKIDDARDTSPPGAGTRGVFPNQPAEIYAEGRFTTAKPISILEYELVLDGTPGIRSIIDYPTLPSGGCGGRLVRAYTSPAGAQRGFFAIHPSACIELNEIVWNPAELVVVACPADFNTDRQIDFFDYLDFTAAYDAEEPRADFNADQQIDMFDYLDFAATFVAGCE